MISIEEMSTPAAVNGFYPSNTAALPVPVKLSGLPVRANSSSTRKTSVAVKLDLLKKLVERVKELELVSVKNVPYLTKSGVVVEIPGPWSLRLSGRSTPTRRSFDGTQQQEENEKPKKEEDDPKANEDDYEEGEEDAESPEQEEEEEDGEDEEEDLLAMLNQANREKFVVRNEFGHVRLTHLIDAMEHFPHGPLPDRLVSQLEVGGHCVLSEEDFFTCVAKKWGEPHPMAGHFHPIAGTMIPETTLLFYTPRNESELEWIWSIVQASHSWALSAAQKDR